MDFYDFVERWCSVHPEIKHIPGTKSQNKRFFLTTGFASMVDFMQAQTAKTSPCVVMESGAPLTHTRDGFVYRDYTIYFCVRSYQQMQQADGREARMCKAEAEKLALTFCNNAIAMNKKWLMKGVSIRVESDYNIEPSGPFWNWWYAAQLTIRVGSGGDTCLGEELLAKLTC